MATRPFWTVILRWTIARVTWWLNGILTNRSSISGFPVSSHIVLDLVRSLVAADLRNIIPELNSCYINGYNNKSLFSYSINLLWIPFCCVLFLYNFSVFNIFTIMLVSLSSFLRFSPSFVIILLAECFEHNYFANLL